MRDGTRQPARVFLVGSEGRFLPQDVFTRAGAQLSGQIHHWEDVLALGPDLRMDALLWFDPPQDEQDWVNAVIQFNRLRPTSGIVLIPADRNRVGEVKAAIQSRRERGQIRSVWAAGPDLEELGASLRRVLSEFGYTSGNVRTSIGLDALRPSARKSPETTALPPEHGRTIVVLGSKGGVGKTTIAVNLACLAQSQEAGSVVLSDLDLEGADVAVHLDMLDMPDLVDLWPRIEVDAGALPRHPKSQLAVIPGPSRPDLAHRVQPEAVEQLLQYLRQRFRWVIVDTTARLSDETAFRAIAMADRLVFVLTPDASSLRMARFLREHADRFGWQQDSKLVTVLNQAYGGDAPGIDQISRFLGWRIDCTVPFDRRAVDVSVLEGRPMVLGQPRHAVAKAFREVAARLELVPDELPESPAGWIGRFSLWWKEDAPWRV